MALVAYFWIGRPDRRLLIAGLSLSLAAVVYVSLLPDYTDSVVMALIHLPFVFWAFLGLVFMGDTWRDADSRLRFIRYNGELVVLASLVALGGMVFSGVTVALFELISDNVEDWYFTNVAVFGATAVPVAGTYLYDAVFNRRTISQLMRSADVAKLMQLEPTDPGELIHGDVAELIAREGQHVLRISTAILEQIEIGDGQRSKWLQDEVISLALACSVCCVIGRRFGLEDLSLPEHGFAIPPSEAYEKHPLVEMARRI